MVSVDPLDGDDFDGDPLDDLWLLDLRPGETSKILRPERWAKSETSKISDAKIQNLHDFI